MLLAASAGASEIFGQISTDPGAPSGYSLPEEEPAAAVAAPATANTGGAAILPLPEKQDEVRQENEIITTNKEVLGVKTYADGTLLRGPDRRVYVIESQIKKHVVNLKELEKYRGHPILDATAKELAGYRSREHLNGELIRQRGEVKVYVIVKGSKRHILNLEELRAHYFGLEIFNISREEMQLY